MNYQNLRKEIRSVKCKFFIKVSQDRSRKQLTFKKNKWPPRSINLGCVNMFSLPFSLHLCFPPKSILTTSFLIPDITLVQIQLPIGEKKHLHILTSLSFFLKPPSCLFSRARSKVQISGRWKSR